MGSDERKWRESSAQLIAVCWLVSGLFACSAAPPSPPRVAASEVEVAPAPEPLATAESPDSSAPMPTAARGWLGVELKAGANSEAGVLIANVVPKAPAAAAGLAAGDVLLQIDGEAVNRPEDVVELVGQRRAGARVNLAFKRGSEHRLTAAVLQPLPNKDDILRMSYVGAPAPAFGPLKAVQGSVAPAVSALRGKVVVLEFWASWCAVCPILVPTMNDWYARFGAQGVEVIGVTTDAVTTAARSAGQQGMKYPIWADESGETTETYRALALPTVFIIDREGVVRDVMVGYSTPRVAELEALVGRLLAQN